MATGHSTQSAPTGASIPVWAMSGDTRIFAPGESIPRRNAARVLYLQAGIATLSLRGGVIFDPAILLHPGDVIGALPLATNGDALARAATPCVVLSVDMGRLDAAARLSVMEHQQRVQARFTGALLNMLVLPAQTRVNDAHTAWAKATGAPCCPGPMLMSLAGVGRETASRLSALLKRQTRAG